MMMMWRMAFRLALRSLLRNRMRSGLTALGVIIGVAALIVTVVTGEGARKMIAAQIASMGSSMLMVVPGASVQGGFSGGAFFFGIPTGIDVSGNFKRRVWPLQVFAHGGDFGIP